MNVLPKERLLSVVHIVGPAGPRFISRVLGVAAATPSSAGFCKRQLRNASSPTRLHVPCPGDRRTRQSAVLRCAHSFILAVSSLVACSSSTTAGMSSGHSSSDIGNTADAELRNRAKASRIERIALSSSGGCALTTDRRLRCWGRDVTNAEPEWHAGFRDLSDIVDIAVGENHACAVRSDG